MAKKSAASKGYRRTQKAKPFLTKKELIALAIIIGVILLGVLAYNIFYDDGFVAPREIRSGDIISRANTSRDDRYQRVATINALEGFTMNAMTSPEMPTGGYVLTPEAEGSLESLRVSGAIWDAPGMMSTVVPSLESMGASSLSEPVQALFQGHDARLCSAYFEETDPETGAPRFSQIIKCYVTVGEYSVSMTATLAGEDASVYVADEDLASYMSAFEGVFTPVTED